MEYQVNALNFLYAVGATERIAYEIKNAVPKGDNSSFQAQATLSDLRYRMTYMPLILLVGLLSALFAALIYLGLAISSRATTSFQTWRDVDSLRLVVDSADGLRGGPGLEVQRLGKEELDVWAQKFLVRYSKESVNSKAAIKLSVA